MREYVIRWRNRLYLTSDGDTTPEKEAAGRWPSEEAAKKFIADHAYPNGRYWHAEDCTVEAAETTP